MNRKTLAALAGLTAITLTGCSAPGWEGNGTVIELEYMEPEREGNGIDHDGLEVSVITDRGVEDSAMVEDCDPGKVILGDTLTTAELTDLCGPLSHSTDD